MRRKKEEGGVNWDLLARSSLSRQEIQQNNMFTGVERRTPGTREKSEKQAESIEKSRGYIVKESFISC